MYKRPVFYALGLLVIATSGLLLEANYSEANKEGKFFGAKTTEYPDWFKDSFLNIPEDIEEAKEANKRVMIFFHQAGCPYCNALVERNMAQKDIRDKIKKNFDIVGINMWGDREVTYINGKQYTEKALALALKVQFTPTLLFYDEKGKIVLRLNGYRSPAKFNVDLDYVALHKENKVSYRNYVKANLPDKKASKKLHNEDFFAGKPYNLEVTKNNKTPIAVFFEQKDCPDCDTLHNKVLPDKTLRKILSHFKVVQLDMWSKTPVTTPDGKNTTARDWADKLEVKFAPSIVVFNEKGEEVIRSEASFKVFHTQGILDYVLSGAYKEQPSFQRYLSERADHIREQGKDVDIWRYADEKPGEHK
ncbi:MAG: thioredoxin fold domain-containing protein [Gammaproteobacteria bacterium]|jgi:thioredoxin-related protein